MLFALRITLESCPILPDLPVLLSWKISACATYHYDIYTHTHNTDYVRVIGAVIHRFTLPMPFHLTRHYLPVTYTSFLSFVKLPKYISNTRHTYQREVGILHLQALILTFIDISYPFFRISRYIQYKFIFIFISFAFLAKITAAGDLYHISFLNFLEKAANCRNTWNICVSRNRDPLLWPTNLYQCFVSLSRVSGVSCKFIFIFTFTYIIRNLESPLFPLQIFFFFFDFVIKLILINFLKMKKKLTITVTNLLIF